jgi:hypothetical protein
MAGAHADEITIATTGKSMTVQVVRKDGEVRIEGVQRWSSGERGSSVQAAQAAIMSALGEDITYTDLVGASGLAFRMQVAKELCPSSPHPHCGAECKTGAIDAIPYEIRPYSIYGDDSVSIDDVRAAVVESIDRGVPVQYESFEDGVITGYRNDGSEWIVLHPYGDSTITAVSPEYAISVHGGNTEWPFWTAWIYSERKSTPPNRSTTAVAAMQKAVEMAHTSEGDGYPLGFNAWDIWLGKLDSLNSADEKTVSGSTLGNSWIYHSLVQYRGIAAEYLRSIADEFDDDVAGHLLNAADQYERIAHHVLTDDGTSTNEVAPGPHTFGEGETWTATMRAEQGWRMREALPLERKAIVEIEAALALIDD